MSATLKDVAKIAGVSASTASRVINNDRRISEETRVRVFESIKMLDYKINNIARSLKTNKTKTVGFVSPEMANDFFMGIAEGVERELGKQGYSVIICCSNENIDEEKSKIDLLCEKCVDGIIIIPVSSEKRDNSKLREAGIPVVLVDRLIDGYAADAVLVDNINGTYSAVECIINSGRRRVGFIGGDIRLTSARERFEGYKRVLADYCIPFEEQIVRFGDFHIGSGYNLMKELTSIENPPNDIFIVNYYMHAGATKFLIEQGGALRSPISIVSFDDMELSSLFGFSKARVSQPIAEIGSKAAQLILGRIGGADIEFPQIVRLKTTLITDV